MDFTAGTDFSADADFSVSVRAAEPVLKFSVSQKTPGLRNDLLQNIAGAVMIGAVLSLFCMAGEIPNLIPFMMPGPAVFLAITMTEAIRPGKLRWLVAAVTAGLLIASMVVWHGRIGGGLAIMMNDFYEMAEFAQAYLYKRLPVPETASELFGAVWISCFLGFVTALPLSDKRRPAIMLLAMLIMFAVAYYGIIPSWICIAVLLTALILTVSRGSVLSVLPLLLVGLLVFGAIMLIDPGESYGISRMDENFRDRFAFHSALLENPDQFKTDTEQLEEQEEETEDFDGGNVFKGDYGPYVAIGVIVLIAALIGTGVYFFLKRLKRKQEAVRYGIDSSDPKTAVTAMFPYSVRWLRACGIGSETPRGEPFSAMLPKVSEELSGDYGKTFGSMYSLWKEAAYSDHAVSEENRQDMKNFMGETIKLVRKKSTTKDKLKIKFIHTL